MKKMLIFIIIALISIMYITQATASENSCIDCHKTLSPFISIQKQFNEIRVQHLEKGVSCSLECHEDRIRQLAKANYQQWSDSVHAMKGITCEYCHGGDPSQSDKNKAHATIKNITDPDSPVYYTNVPKTCGNCHSKELKNFEESKHYKKLKDLKLAPTCTTCHPPHKFTIRNKVEFNNFCGNCHSVTKKIAPYEVPVKAEYLLSKVNKLKFNIDTTEQDIFWAEKNGTDVTQARKYLENAVDQYRKLAPMWHEFNLTFFENQVEIANKDIEKAKEEIGVRTTTPTATKTPTKTTPGFISILGIISLVAAVYLRSKRI